MTTKAMDINLNSRNARKQIQRVLQNALKDAFASAVAQYAPRVVEMADDNREFTQFTGNTVSSYMAGVYKDGTLFNAFTPEGRGAAYPKVQKDETVYLSNPVEGMARSVKGTVDIVTDYGEELSREVLAQQSPQGGTGMVVTTGTEYSQYLEKVHGLDVLTDTYSEVANSARNDLQRIIDKQSR